MTNFGHTDRTGVQAVTVTVNRNASVRNSQEGPVEELDDLKVSVTVTISVKVAE